MFPGLPGHHSQGYTLPNFHRVEKHFSPDEAEQTSEEPFSWEELFSRSSWVVSWEELSNRVVSKLSALWMEDDLAAFFCEERRGGTRPWNMV